MSLAETGILVAGGTFAAYGLWTIGKKLCNSFNAATSPKTQESIKIGGAFIGALTTAMAACIAIEPVARPAELGAIPIMIAVFVAGAVTGSVGGYKLIEKLLPKAADAANPPAPL